MFASRWLRLVRLAIFGRKNRTPFVKDRSKKNGAQLLLEGLEQRITPSGVPSWDSTSHILTVVSTDASDVIISKDGLGNVVVNDGTSDLTITGGPVAANMVSEIDITASGGLNNQINLKGVLHADFTALTSVNVTAAASTGEYLYTNDDGAAFTFTSALDDVHNDFVANVGPSFPTSGYTITAIDVPNVQAGDGVDTFGFDDTLGPVQLTGTINGGGGDDTFNIARSNSNSLSDSFSLQGGDGNDTFAVSESIPATSGLVGGATLDGGTGTDTLDESSWSTTGTTAIVLAQGSSDGYFGIEASSGAVFDSINAISAGTTNLDLLAIEADVDTGVYDVTGAGAGTLNFTGADSGSLAFTGFNPGDPMDPLYNAFPVSISAFNGLSAMTVNFDNGADDTLGANTTTIDYANSSSMQAAFSTDAAGINFNTPTSQLTIDGDNTPAGAGTADDTININTVDPAFSGSLTVDGGAGTDEIDLNTDLALGNASTIGDLTLMAETINLNASSITTNNGPASAGSVEFTGNTVLKTNVSIDTSSPVISGFVNFDGAGAGTVNADDNTAVGADRTLTINTGNSASVTFGGSVGAGTNGALAGLDVTSPTINIAGAAVNVNDGDASPLPVSFNGAVVLQNNVTVNTNRATGTDNSLTFGGTINADDAGANDRTLSVDAGNATVTIDGAIGNSQALADLDISAAAINLNGGSIKVDDQGNNTVTFTGAVTLGADTTIDTDAASGSDNSVIFDGTVDSDGTARDLGITSGGGNVTFTGDVGLLAPIDALSVSSANNVSAEAIAATSFIQAAGTGTTTLHGPVSTTGAAGVNLTTNAINVNSTINTSGGGTVTFTNAGQLTIAAAGDISADGAVTQNGAGAVSTAGDISTTNDAISFTSGITLTGDVQMSAGSGSITYSSTIDGGFGLTANSTGTTTFGGAVGTTPLGSVTTDAGGTTAINGGSVTTTGDQSFGDNVTLGANTTLAGANVSIGGTLNSPTTARTLAVNTSGGGTTTFTGAVGNTDPLASVTTNADGTTRINGGSVHTTGDQTYNDPVTLGADATLTGINVSFVGTLNSADATARALTVNTSSSGITTFGGAVGVGNQLASVTTNADGTTRINGGAVKTSGNQNYGDKVTLGADTTLTTHDATFSDTLDSAAASPLHALTVNTAGGGVTTFNGIVGGTHPLSDLVTNADGSTHIGAAAIHTQGSSQVYNDPVVLTSNTSLTDVGSGITFNSTVDADSAASNRTLTTTATTGTVTFGDNVGSGQALADLDATAVTINLKGANVVVNAGGGNTVTLTGGVVLGNNVTINTDGAIDNSVNFAGTVDADDSGLNNRNLVVTAGTGSVTFGGLVGDGQALADLDVTAATIHLNTTNINVNDQGGNTVTFTGSVVLGQNVNISASNGVTNNSVDFIGTVNADLAANNRQFFVNAGLANVSFEGNVGASQALGRLDVTATTINLNAPSVIVNAGPGAAAATFQGAVVLGANVTITTDGPNDNNLQITGTINADNAGAQDRTLTILAGTGTVELDSNVGNTQPLADLDVTGSTIMVNGSSITVNDGPGGNTVTFTGNTVLGNNVTINTDGANNNNVSLGAVDADAAANNRTLNVTADTGVVTFGGSVGASQALADLDATGSQINLNASTFNVNAGPGGNTVTLTGNVQLGANVTLNTDGTNDNSVNITGNVNADSATSQDRKLAITAGTGTVTFGNSVGNSQALADLDVTGATINLGGTTYKVDDDNSPAATVTFNGAVVLKNTVTIDVDKTSVPSPDNSVIFNGSINADNSSLNNRILIVAAGNGSATFNGNVGTNALGALAGLMVTGATINLNASTFNVNDGGGNAASFTGNTVLGTDVSINTNGLADNDITFAGNVDSDGTARSLTLESDSRDIHVTGTVGASSPIHNLAITSARNATFDGTIQTTGNMTQTAGTGTTTLNGTGGGAIGGNLNLTTDSVKFASGTTTVVGTTTVSAATNIDFNSGALSSGSPVTLSAGTSITADTVNTDVTASTLILSAGAGGIGSGTNPLRTDVGTIQITTTSGGNATINEASGIDFGNGNTSVAGDLSLTAAGSITDSNNVNVTGHATFSAGANSITLDSANDNFGTLTFTGSTVTIDENSSTDLAGSSSATTLNLTSNGPIDDGASGTLAVSGTATLNAGAGNNITLDNANDFGTVKITAGDDVTLNDLNALNLGASTISGNLVVTTAGAITDNGAVTIAGTTSLAAGTSNDITLDNADDFGGSVTVVSGRNVTLNDVNALNFAAAAVTNNLVVTTNGNITDSGTVTVGGTTNLTAGTGNVVLDEATDDFGGAVSVVSSANTTLRDANDLSVGLITATTNVNLTATGSITGDGGNDVSASTLSAGAGTGINLATTIATLSSANVSGTGAISISDTGGGLTVTSATTADGSITLSTSGGDLTLTSVSAGGSGANVSATTTGSGNILVHSVSALGDKVSLQSAGNVTGTGAGTDLTADKLEITGSTSVGSLDTAVSNLEVSSSGSVAISNTGNLTIGGVGALTGISGSTVNVSTTGTLTVSEAVTGSGAVDLTGNGTIDINAGITGAPATVHGGAGVDTITVNNTGSSTLNLDGADAGDNYIVNLSASITSTVAVSDTGASGTDTTTINDAPGADTTFNVTGAQTTGGGHTVTYSGVEQVDLNAGDGNDDVTITPSATVAFALDGGPANDTLHVNAASVTFNGNQVSGPGFLTFTQVNFENVTTDATDVTVTTGAGSDHLTLSEVGGIRQYQLTGFPAVQINSANTFTWNSGAGSDLMTVTYSGGDPVPAGGVFYNGEGGLGDTDGLQVIGTGTQSATYTPDAATTGNGVIAISSKNITFTGLEPIDISAMASVTIATPTTGNKNDTLSIANGSAAYTASTDALTITGTVGDTTYNAGNGVAIEPINVFNVGTLTIDTTSDTGSDSITIASANNAHAVSNLTIKTGSNALDSLTVNGAATVSGTFNAQVPTVNLNANVTATTISGTATVVNVAAPGQIQDGVDVAASGATVNVAAGKYVGNNVVDALDGVVAAVLINKPLTLLGPQTGFNPSGPVPGEAAQAIIEPGTSDPTLDANESVIIEVTSSNVTIKGLTIRGSNDVTMGFSHFVDPMTMSNVTIAGHIVDAAEGIVSYRGVGHIDVSHNIIQYLSYTGVDFYNADNGGAATSTNTISNNLIHDLSNYINGIGVVLYNNFYADVTNNVMNNVRVGVQTGNFFNANPGSTASISNNTIAATRRGIYYNLHSTPASSFTIATNTITAIEDAGETLWDGIAISSQQTAVNVTILNNTIDGSATDRTSRGYYVWNTPTTANLTISGGTVTGVKDGVLVTNYDALNGNGDNTHITVSGVSITASQVGVLVQDSPSNTNGATVTATVTNGTSITSTGGTGVQVTGSDASVTVTASSITGSTIGIQAVSGGKITSVTNNFITGNTTGIKIESDAGTIGSIFNNKLTGSGSFAVDNLSTTPVDASGNYWGSASLAAVSATVNGPVDYSPYLNLGADTSATAGFQGDFSDLTVHTSGTQTGALGRIQEGVNLIADGSLTGAGRILDVTAGTYKENVTVDRAVMILGNNAGTAGSSGGRVAESIVVTNGNQNAVITISANGVTLDGLYIDGDDTTVTGSALTSGDDANVLYGVRASAAFSNLTVQNDIVKHAFIGFRGDGSASSNLITRNWFDSIGFYDFGYAVSLRTNYYADVTDNLMTRVQSGLATLNFSGATGPATWLFQGNTVEAYGAGVWHNLQYNGATTLTIDNNDISGLTAPVTAANAPVRANFDGRSMGILVTSIQDSVGVIITNNTFHDLGYGATFWNTTTSNAITVGSTNSIHDNSVGVFLTDDVGFDPVTTTVLGQSPNFPSGISRVTLDGVTLVSNTTGILVNGTNTNNIDSVNRGASLTVQNGVTVTGGTTGLKAVGQYAKIAGNTLNNTAFSGQSGDHITLSTSAMAGIELNATSVTFNGTTGAAATLTGDYAIVDKITDAVDLTGLGFVRIKALNVFVTPNSFAAPNMMADIQRAVSVASASGDTIHIEGGSYFGNVDTTTKSVTLDHGASPAQVTINGNVTFDANDTLVIEINGSTTPGTDYDQLVVIGTVSLGGINLTGSSGPLAVGSQITLIDNDDTDAVSGTFTPNSTVTLNNRVYSINYMGGDGNDVVLTRIAQTYVWSGGAGADHNWTTGANWVDGFAPSLGDYLLFDDTGVLADNTPFDNFGAGSEFGKITFNTTAGSYSISGNSITLITLGGGIFNTAGTNTLGLDFTTNTNTQTIDATAGTLNLTGAVTLGTSGISITGGTGNVSFGAAVDGGQSISINTGGDVTFNAAVGGSTAVSGISVTNVNNLDFGSTIQTTGNVNQAAGTGDTTFNGTSGTGIGGTLSVATVGTVSFASGTTTVGVATVGVSAANISFAGGGSLSNAPGIDTLSATSGITTDPSGTDVTASTLILSSGAAGIGSSGNPLRTDVGTLQITTTGGGNAFVSDVSGIDLGNGATSVSGDLGLTTGGTITDTQAVTVTGNANFNAGANAITLGDSTAASFGSLTFTGGAVAISETGSTLLSGTSTANSLTLSSTAGITNTASANVTVTGNASVSGTSISLGTVSGDSMAFGSLTFNSGGAVSISEDDSTLLSGTSTAGSLTLASTAGITNDGTANVTVTGNASVSGTSISLGTVSGDSMEFGSLTFNSAGAVSISEDDSTLLSGTSTAGSLTLASTAGITNDGTANVTVTGNASVSGTSISLGTVSGDSMAFGSLTFNSGGAVSISEDDSTLLSGTSTAGSLTLASTAGITNDGTANVTVTGNASVSGTSISLGTVSGDSMAFGSLTFNSGGAVSISEDDSTLLSGTSTADSLTLASTAGITNDGTANVTVTGNASVSGTSISLGTVSGDSMAFGSLTFNSAGAVSISEDDSTLLSGTSTAGSLTLASTAGITNDGTANVTVTGNASVSGTSISLGTVSGDSMAFGSLTFNSGGAVSISEDDSTLLSGTSTAGSLTLSSTAGITNTATANVTVTGNASVSGTSISLGTVSGDSMEFGSLTFNSAGAVSISEDDSTLLSGTSTAGSLTLASTAGITNDGTANVTVTGNASVSGTSISLGTVSGDSMEFGSLTFNSAGAVSISENDSTLLSGTSTAGSLTLASTAGITNDGTANVTVTGNASVSGTSISLGTVSGDSMAFGSLTFNSGGAVSISEDDSTLLSGTSTAGSLTLASTAGITNDGTANVTVTGNASVSGTSISLGTVSGDSMAFGSLTFNSAGAVSISEDDSTLLSGTSTANSLTLAAAGAITDATDADMAVTGNATFTAATSITLGDEANNADTFGSLDASGTTISISQDDTMNLNLVSGTGAVSLTSETGSILDNNGSSTNVVGTDLFLSATAGGAGTSGDALETTVSTLEANVGSGGLFVSDLGGLSIVDGADANSDGINSGGAVSVTTTGALAVNAAVKSTAGDVSLTANGSGTDNLTVGANVEADSGNVTLNAGGDINVQVGTTVQASGAIALNFGTVNDGTAAATISGTLQAATATATGTAGNSDTLTINYATAVLNITAPAGLAYHGGAGMTDSLIGNGSAGIDTFTIDGTTLTENANSPVTYDNLENETINAGDGNDIINLNGGSNITAHGNNDDDTFNVNGTVGGAAFGDDGNDRFFLNSGSVTSVDGGTGTDHLDYSGRTGSAAVTLTAIGTGDGFQGNATGIATTFNNIDDLVGSAGADTLNGSPQVSIWSISGSNSGNYNAGGRNETFSAFETLTGSTANDTFQSVGNVIFAGTINGGVGTDTINYGTNTTGRTFTLNAANGGNVGGNAFASIENLAGGSGNDTFALVNDTASLTGTITGNGGTNTLDYTGRTGAVRVNLLGTPTAGATGGISGIQNVTGGSGNDILIGDNNANVLNGGAGNDILIGNGGNDTLSGGDGLDILIGGTGADSLDGGTGDDILVAASTTYDNNISALTAIQLEWTRAGVDFNTRTGRIFGTLSGGLNGSFKLNGTTITNDGIADTLFGGLGNDWFLDHTGEDILSDVPERQDSI